jgi:ribose transport system substrate-binding protein
LKAAETLLVAHPDVNSMLSENDSMLLGGLKAVNDAGLQDQVKLFTSNDAQKEGLKAILDNTAYKMTGENRPLKVAEEGVKMAVDILVNGVDPASYQKQTLLPPVPMDINNASQFYDENAVF